MMLLDQSHDVTRWANVAEEPEKRCERGLVESERVTDVGVRDHRDLIFQFDGVTGRRLATNVRDESTDKEVFYAAALELLVEVAAPGKECACVQFRGVNISWLNYQFVSQDGSDAARLAVVDVLLGDFMTEPARQVCRVPDSGGNESHSSASLAQSHAEPVDAPDGRASEIGLSLTGSDVQVDDHQRRLGRRQVFVGVESPSASHDLVHKLLRNLWAGVLG